MMARYNKIYAGPYTEAMPQVREAKADAAILPGTFIVTTATGFANADASTTGKVYIAQENYLLGKGVDDPWAAGDTTIGMEPLNQQLFYVRVPTGINVSNGAELTSDANGKAVLAAAADAVFMFADEAYNNTSGEDQMVRARPATGYVKA